MSMSTPAPPQVTDPNVTAANQQALNLQAGEESQAASNVNQQTATGSLTYNQTGTGPGGVPLYTATSSLSPAQQSLLTALQGGASGALASGNYGSGTNAGTAIGDATQGLTQQAMSKEVGYLNPYFQTQTQQLDTQLRNQGLAPGQPGYDNAMRALQNNQGNTVTGFEASMEPQMFQQATSEYLAPLNVAATEMGLIPGVSNNTGFVTTPTNTTQPANLVAATASAQQAQEQAYQQQVANQTSMMSGLFGIPTAILGGWARGGGLQGLGSSLGSMFGGGTAAGADTADMAAALALG